MRVGDSWRKLASSDLAVLVLWATAGVLLHTVTNGQYGFHSDELATLDDARSLAWGYVAYPPLTPFLARVAFILFGPSLIGLRLFPAVALGLVLVLTGLMARHLGGGRQAQIVAALAAAIGGIAFSGGTLFQYVSFDYLWWVAAAYSMVRLLTSDDPRWCLAVGAAIGLGMLTKYTMIFLAVGIAAGFLFTPARRYLRSGTSDSLSLLQHTSNTRKPHIQMLMGIACTMANTPLEPKSNRIGPKTHPVGYLIDATNYNDTEIQSETDLKVRISPTWPSLTTGRRRSITERYRA
jgi:hypothetical protein